jgi:O-antigen/teichoic acid export membrane protein
MFRSALLILSGNAAASILLLARNLIVARMIPVADYGVAATFAMAMAVVEMASSLGLQQQIIQSKEGDDPHFQAALQGFQVMRGLFSAALLFALAGPLARFLDIPEVIWAYQILALVPVFNALVHFDIHRLNRHMRFAPMVLTGAVPAALALALVWPLAIWLGDWQVMLWSILAQAGFGAITSHLVAERPYRLKWDSKITAGCLQFGWPLLINAVLLFLVFQGDKIIVGRVLGMEPLAIFSMGVTLTLTPTLVLAKSAQNLLLPRLSRIPQQTDADRVAFDQMSHVTLQVALLNGALVLLAVSLFGAQMIHLLLGPKYASLVPLFTGFALVYSVRVFKAGPAVIALARGFTGNSMAANLPRVAALPLGWVLLQHGGSLAQLVRLGATAEMVGFILSLILVSRRPGVHLAPLWPTALAMTVFLVAASDVLSDVIVMPVWAAHLVTLVSFGLLLVTMRNILRPLKYWRKR